MKPSRYNYILSDGDRTIFFNGITECFFRVPNDRVEAYSTIINHPDENLDAFGSFINKMKTQGFVLEEGVNEETLVEAKYDVQRKPHEYHLMVLPTYQCNLRCWYCIQDHKDMWMSEKTVEGIKKRIVCQLDNPEITHMHFSWFGGEPMLCYDTMLELTSFSKMEAEKRGKTFSCHITTNGTLLNEKRIEELREAGVSGYQITIDGTREKHDSVKVLKNASAYDRSMQNIDLIAKHTSCSLRLNYTKENLDPEGIIRDVKSKLSEESMRNIVFLLYKVWQESEESIPEGYVEKIYGLANKANMFPKLPRTGLCYADQKYFDCIFPNGKVEKCDNNPLEGCRGEITENGEIIWSGELDDLDNVFESQTSSCMECSYFPMCWGPCAGKRKYLKNKNGDYKCPYENKEEFMDSIIKNVCKNIERFEMKESIMNAQ